MPVQIRRAYVDLPQGQIHYRYSGAPDAPCLLLLHQSPSSSVMYEALMRELAAQFRVYAPDLPGFGLSDSLPGDVSVPTYAAAMHAFLDEVGVRSCGVFGHHTGAAVAVALAAAAPLKVTGLALSGPPLLSPELKASLPGRASQFPPQEEGGHLLAMWQRFRDKDSAAPLALSQREVLAALGSGASYPASYVAVAAYDYAAALAAVSCPALVFAGDEDILRDAVAPTLAKLENATTVAISGGGASYVCERETEQVAAALLRFFSSD